jgi:hypothetical protein
MFLCQYGNMPKFLVQTLLKITKVKGMPLCMGKIDKKKTKTAA